MGERARQPARVTLASTPESSDDIEDWAASQASEIPSPPGSDLHGSPRLARAILLTVLCGFLAVQVIDILTSPIESYGLDLGVGLACVVVVFTLQVFISSSPADKPAWWRMGMLTAQALVTYLPLIVLGKEWAGMTGFLAGSALLLVSGWAAWALFAAIIGSMLVGPIMLGLGAYSVAYLTVASLDIGLIVFGLSRLSTIVRYVHAARAELAQLAVIRERMRFARDLHDLLGYSLSAITLKAELTRRLIGANPARARDELGEVLDISRQALADVRLVASSYRNLSFAKEAASVTSLLSTAGIAAEVEINCGALAEKVDTVLATVLREAVTNILRHSAAQHCSIEANQAGGTVRLRIVNDGVPRLAANLRSGGGLENLAVRLAAVGGTLTATILPAGRFEVRVETSITGIRASAQAASDRPDLPREA
jgi:two-component system, NarL family, sensor histidine kinase DesK